MLPNHFPLSTWGLGVSPYDNLPSLGTGALTTGRASTTPHSARIALPGEDHAILRAPPRVLRMVPRLGAPACDSSHSRIPGRAQPHARTPLGPPADPDPKLSDAAGDRFR